MRSITSASLTPFRAVFIVIYTFAPPMTIKLCMIGSYKNFLRHLREKGTLPLTPVVPDTPHLYPPSPRIHPRHIRNKLWMKTVSSATLTINSHQATTQCVLFHHTDCQHATPIPIAADGSFRNEFCGSVFLPAFASGCVLFGAVSEMCVQ
jgi:hypothetical protein